MKSVFKWIIVSIISAVMLFAAVDFLFSPDGLRDYCMVNNKYFPDMLLELGVATLLVLCGAIWSNLSILIIIVAVFSYISLMFLPMTLAFAYVVLTVFVGESVNKRVIKIYEKGRLEVDFIVGAMILTIIYAIMSALSIGGVLMLRIALIICASFALLDNRMIIQKLIYPFNNHVSRMQCTRKRYLLFSLMTIPVLIQIGRLNNSIDYDSYWYGLRSKYILDNISGIYDNIPFTAGVYTYPKGFETYSLPLSSSVCCSFVPAINVIFLLLILRTVYFICREFVSEEKSLIASVMISIVPGIVNMSTTAKSDIITLMVQLFLMYFFILYLNGKDMRFIGLTFAAYIYSQTLKPTAAVFSSIILISVIFFLLKDRVKGNKVKQIGMSVVLLSLIDLGFIWARTFLLTGIPETQVWGGVFRKIGFVEKYPFFQANLGAQTLENIFRIGQLKMLILDLYDFLVNPRIDSRMAGHVFEAWGSTLVTGIIILCVPYGIYRLIAGKKKSDGESFIVSVFLLQVCSLIGIIMVRNWLDGNYFMLLYAISIITAVVLSDVDVKGCLVVGFWGVCFYACNVLLLLTTNWPMIIRFTEPDYFNKGYYNHLAEYELFMRESYRCDKLYDKMAASTHNKVFAIGDHISGARIPCIVESDLDIGAYGNTQLAHNKEFHKYVDFVDFDYIFIFSNKLNKDNCWYDNVIELFDAGMITGMEEENGNILLRVGDADSNLSVVLREEFANYIGTER